MELSQVEDAFSGTDRFKIRRRLGAGGMGVVYEAYDVTRGEAVALKTLRRAEASALYFLKNEFRALADVAHPNLINLYEFIVDGDHWFFTMEFIDGVHFLDHVRPGARPAAALPIDGATSATTVRGVLNADERVGARESFAGHVREDRLRSALRQLAEGLVALHDKRVLHRDIKSSNVLVTRDDRLVILDFGISSERVHRSVDEREAIIGTPLYMSPEQAASLPVTEASDWYSVGVMLYCALTGRFPFEGSAGDVLRNKVSLDPPPPSALAENVPHDLDELCAALLKRRPQSRPTGRTVLERLLPTSASGQRMTVPLSDTSFFGREPLLAELTHAFNAARNGHAVSVCVHGASGMGKSALIRHFLDGLDADGRALVLAGRCFERESVPYKAIDGIVDRLSRYLRSLSAERASEVIPRDARALARVFPVLLEVEAVASAPKASEEIPDPLALRRRAFAALRELLSRIGQHQPLVLIVDDLQWSDVDSMALIEDLLRPPDAPHVLLIVSFRAEEVDAKPFLRDLLARAGTDTRRAIRVDPLTTSESERLARSVLGTTATRHASLVEAIVRESGGSPFFLEQLAVSARESAASARDGISLAEMLDIRLRLLPAGARPLLSTLAVAGRPVDASVAYVATDLTGDERPLIASLRAARFLRSSGTAERIELYHDRIRETLVAMLDGEARRRIHRSLAGTLEARGFDDPGTLYEHYLGAGERDRAGQCAVLAARKAASALAFEQAASYYRHAQELATASGADPIELKKGLGEALVNAGRSAEGAHVFLDVARHVDPSQALEFRRRAAEQLLMGGHTDEGLGVIRTVLGAVGFKLPGGPRRALISLLLRRAHLRVRGLTFVERGVGDIPSEDLQRIDVCWAVAAGLSLSDTIRGADFQTRNLLLALRSGELYRIARAISIETGFSSIPGGPRNRRSAELQAIAERLAQRVGHPHAIGVATLWTGVAACLLGEWRKAFSYCDRALEILRDRCVGVVLDMATAQRFLLYSLMNLGETAELRRRLPLVLATAREQGNRYLTTDLRTAMNIAWLIDDDPEGARAEVEDAMREWSHESFVLQHYYALQALTHVDLYTGDGRSAWRRLEDRWPAMKRSLLLRIQTVRIEAWYFRGRSAIAAAASGGDVPSLLSAADRAARCIDRERMHWSRPVASLLRAGTARLRGQVGVADAHLSVAADAFERVDMHLLAAVTRRQLGELRGGDEGRRLVCEADAWMTSQRIARPRRIARMLAPGFPGDEER